MLYGSIQDLKQLSCNVHVCPPVTKCTFFIFWLRSSNCSLSANRQMEPKSSLSRSFMNEFLYLQKMLYGRGVYMSENPSFCKTYGNSLILSRVLRPIYPGYGRVVTKDWCKLFVIPDSRQILPYCTIELQNWDDNRMLLHSLRCMYNVNAGKCLIPMCREKMNVLHHMRGCDLKPTCAVKECFSMWTTIQHWSRCQRKVCSICLTYRKFKATQEIFHDLATCHLQDKSSSDSSSPVTVKSLESERRCLKRPKATTIENKSKKPRFNFSTDISITDIWTDSYPSSSDSRATTIKSKDSKEPRTDSSITDIWTDSYPSSSDSGGWRERMGKLPDDSKLLEDHALKSRQMSEDGLSNKTLRGSDSDCYYVPQLHHPLLSGSLAGGI